MFDRNHLKGVIAALPTPFGKDEEVDENGVHELTDYVIRNRVHGIMTTGGNGEFPHLTGDERRHILELVLERAKGKTHVIACTAACSSRETVALSRHAANAGADAVILVPPFYFSLPVESVLSHFKKVAESIPIPLVVYNNPEYTGCNITIAMMEKLAAEKNIIGLKQSNYNISETFEIIRKLGEEISILTGIDSQLYSVLSLGGRGVFSTAASVIPAQMVEIYEAFESGDITKAFSLQKKVQVINRFFEYDPGYVTPCKEALRILGLPGGSVRSPLPRLEPDQIRQMQEALQILGLLRRSMDK